MSNLDDEDEKRKDEEAASRIAYIHDAGKKAEAERSQQRRGLPVMWGAEAMQPQPLLTVVKGLLYSGALTLVYGPPKSGKSFWLTDLFLAVAGGKDQWMGHRIVRGGPTLYFACEGHAGYWRRLQAAGHTPDNFGLVACRTSLISLRDRFNVAVPDPDDILNTFKDIDFQGQEPPVAIAIDTVFRSFGSGNVNQSDHMNAYIAALTKIMDARGIAVAVVHHATKVGTTPAGSVSLIGAADTIIATKNGNGNLHTWEIEAAKDDATTEPRQFSLDVVEIGTDEYGEPITSCVMTDQGFPDAATAPKRKGRPPRDAEREFAMAVLAEAILDHGEARPPELLAAGSIGTVVQFDRWRELYLRKTGAGELPDTVRKRLRRIKNTLRDQGFIGTDKDWVWLIDGT